MPDANQPDQQPSSHPGPEGDSPLAPTTGAGLAQLLEKVQRAARAGARAVVDDPQFVEDAAETAVEKLEDRVVAGRMVDDPKAWGWKVGHHEALRLTRRRDTTTLGHREVDTATGGDRAGPTLPSPTELRHALSERRDQLTKKQVGAVEDVLRYGSLSKAAKARGQDRSSFGRLFGRALDRLRWSRRHCAPQELGAQNRSPRIPEVLEQRISPGLVVVERAGGTRS